MTRLIILLCCFPVNALIAGMRCIFILSLLFVTTSLSAEGAVLKCATSDSTYLLWHNESYGRDTFYFTTKNKPRTELLRFSIPGYDVDSFSMHSIQIDAMGQLEIVLSYTSFEGRASYIDDHLKEQRITRIFNPDSQTELFHAISRIHELNMHHGSEYGGEETRYLCDWSYDLRIDEKGWIYVTNVTVHEDCKAADKKNGVYTFESGKYKWHEH